MQGAAMCFRPELLSLKRDTCALMVYNGPQVYKAWAKLLQLCAESLTHKVLLLQGSGHCTSKDKRAADFHQAKWH